jgi:HAD superfamily hydrolase (TIGR01509 family)
VTRALVFDCDGVLADTERDGHLVAFNQMWREQGVDWQWTVEQYAEKLKIGGGKERIASLQRDAEFRAAFPVPASDDAWLAVVARWHKRKSEIFQELVMSGAVPGRPGVQRLAAAAAGSGWTLAVCSTSATASVQAVLKTVMGDELAGRFAGVFAGDIVKAKKPAPDIYNHAADALGLSHRDCVVVEDSRNGLVAATAAGMACVITQNALTAGEDFTEAALVVDSLGDPGEPARIIANRSPARPSGMVTLADLEAIVAGVAAAPSHHPAR